MEKTTGSPNTETHKQRELRLIAAWVVCEVFLGGIIHGLHLPISGLIVGGCAIVIISQLAWLGVRKGQIIKAAIIVAIFKMILSPQSPPMAYVAVLFQGLLAEAIYAKRNRFKTRTILFAMIALFESALQRVLVMTIIFGNDLWQGINELGKKIIGQQTQVSLSILIVSLHVIIHLCAGYLIGNWAAALHKKPGGPGNLPIVNPFIQKKESAGKKYSGSFLLALMLLLTALYIQSAIPIGNPLFSPSSILALFLRSTIVIGAWIFVASPLLKWLLKKWLTGKQTHLHKEISAIAELLPAVQDDAAAVWQSLSEEKKWKRALIFPKAFFLQSLLPNKHSAGIVILTANKGAGKTSFLEEWVKNRSDAGGVLSPLRKGTRFFKDIGNGKEWKMEAEDSDSDILAVGKYLFSSSAFDRASAVVEASMMMKRFTIIDEIGPLEMASKGFAKLLQQPAPQSTLILVVRESMKEEVIKHFQLEHCLVVKLADITA